jgi:hypothetical protein
MFFRGGRRLFPVGVMRSLPFCLSPVCLLFGGGEGDDISRPSPRLVLVVMDCVRLVRTILERVVR